MRGTKRKNELQTDQHPSKRRRLTPQIDWKSLDDIVENLTALLQDTNLSQRAVSMISWFCAEPKKVHLSPEMLFAQHEKFDSLMHFQREFGLHHLVEKNGMYCTAEGSGPMTHICIKLPDDVRWLTDIRIGAPVICTMPAERAFIFMLDECPDLKSLPESGLNTALWDGTLPRNQRLPLAQMAIPQITPETFGLSMGVCFRLLGYAYTIYPSGNYYRLSENVRTGYEGCKYLLLQIHSDPQRADNNVDIADLTLKAIHS